MKIIRGKEEGQRPARQEIASEGPSAKAYWLQWDSLLLRDGVLQRKWESPNLRTSIFQIIVPQKKNCQVNRYWKKFVKFSFWETFWNK